MPSCLRTGEAEREPDLGRGRHEPRSTAMAGGSSMRATHSTPRREGSIEGGLVHLYPGKERLGVGVSIQWGGEEGEGG